MPLCLYVFIPLCQCVNVSIWTPSGGMFGDRDLSIVLGCTYLVLSTYLYLVSSMRGTKRTKRRNWHETKRRNVGNDETTKRRKHETTKQTLSVVAPSHCPGVLHIIYVP
ncbi:hypothetical protein F5050DRAFT_1791700 [Lentinula boryana]|uniref:Uncharacterized protein n=1 Tax=Lentinula boryana TaxID=40481 RepID=A0ABQ8PZP5_9AGAR|nr:hypothetical protein F5050DRAFT_1791700 [Lentinula boryana]